MDNNQAILQRINNCNEDQKKILLGYLDKFEKQNIENIKPNRDHIDKSTKKYKILLKYVNGILKNCGKDKIDDLTKFKDIDRLDIIKPENNELLDKLAPRLFKHYNKHNYYRKTKNIVLNCLRGMCKELGFEFRSRKHNRQVKSIFQTHMLYTIY